ncbi:AAA family ATPase [Microbacterium sp. 2C]|uniref:MinD/ParA family ATP-binding protein n=1 Tax=Microbacterium paulum TaxID=2707006 RepID=UPI0018C2B1F7|nr:AAA family ATPase [Microbacterium paulum]MBG0717033.1 AAA family ATPase [Microbacterium paulum]
MSTTLNRAFATVEGSTARFTTLDGRSEDLAAQDGSDIRRAIIQRAIVEARRTGSTVELVTSGDRGSHRIHVAPDGTSSPVDDGASTLRRTRNDPDLASNLDADTPSAVVDELPTTETPHPVEPAPTAKRASFIPASTGPSERANGWRALLARWGLVVKPSPTQVEHDERIRLASRHWAGCRTIAVVNGKGGVGKTLTTAMLSAVFGRFGGGNVLAWDNNDTRGTLGWRTETGLYDTTIRDLLPATSNLLSPDAGVSDITRFVHHQSADRYDVLRSNPELLAADQRLTSTEFEQLMRVAARYYRLVVFDSGNDESADRWLSMVDHSTQLVVPTLTAPESAESAALLLEALGARDERSHDLARNAVVVVTQAEPARPAELRDIVLGFEGRVRDIVVIPFDPVLKRGPLRFDDLRTPTREAWIRAAAATAAGL